MTENPMPDSTVELKGSKRFHFIEPPFEKLMQNRIHKILLICSSYDAFVLEEDGRIDEQIFNEYVALNLRYPPQFIQASSDEKAFEILKNDNIDLVITMLNIEGMGPFELAKNIKRRYENIPIVVLTSFSREISVRLSREDTSAIDYIFCWLGDADLLLAIIKLIEDVMNVAEDVNLVGVQVIILIEDSIRFYSSYLPVIYKIIFEQSKEFMSEGLNEHQKMLRMRGRPKILLATNYNEAEELYKKYRLNVLGVISDVSYKHNGVKDPMAGIKFSEMVKKDNKYTPVLLQSSRGENQQLAKEIRVGFLNKNTKSLIWEIRNFIREYFAFGDFKFINPDDQREIMRISDLKEMQKKLFHIPEKSLRYHLSRDHFSKWLNARALFPLAELFKYLQIEDFESLDHVKRFMFDAIASFRINKGRGIIAKFYRDRFDEYLTFTRIGEGSLGGKARGLAFLDSIIKKNWVLDKYEDVVISIPKTVVLTTDVFDEFMEQNNLYPIALSDNSDEIILDHFIKAQLPTRIHQDLYYFIDVINRPVAVRSSSLLEDSHYQPFAGVYSTYMVPHVDDRMRMIEILSQAIKSVYASAFYAESKAYMVATSNLIAEEKMGIVLQEVIGHTYDNKFYPQLSGVARSVNFYPIEPEKPEDGITNISFGLGKNIVEGGVTLRFSPRYPDKILQLSSPEMALRETQKTFYALSLNPDDFTPSVKDDVNILKLRLRDAQKDGSLDKVASTFDFENNILRDGKHYKGRKVLTFSNILKYKTFPLADILCKVLETGQKEMNLPIEIEFVVDLEPENNSSPVFYLLQIRPIVNNEESLTTDITGIEAKDTIIHCETALGNGEINDVYDIVYVKTENFKAENNKKIVPFINKLNAKMVEEGRNYVLVGPGRWGSSDHWLGIPVKWAHISNARLIVESGLPNYRIDPSQGTHFFQNLTSFRVGYFTINPFTNDGFYDYEFLSQRKAIYENEYLRHIRFKKPITIKIDGQKKIGVLLKPDCAVKKTQEESELDFS